MSILKINAKEKHEISPYLYMQFMEPLGTADSSVDAAWDFVENDWYPIVVDATKELAPTMIRFGGCFASYYHWCEAVGPMSERVPMINHCWGGLYHNRVGTHEFLDFCKRVGAEPLLVGNMESEGLKMWQRPKNDTVRMGTAEEAADWVSYCNDPDNALRISHGVREPYGVKYWQVGNETSYTTIGQLGFSAEECYETTARFAEAMRRRDDSIKLIGWGDRNKLKEEWAPRMSEVDGIDLLAFHHHFGSGLPDSPLVGTDYRKDPDETWRHLMNAHVSLDKRISQLRALRGNKRLAMTEGHFMLAGRNRNEVISSWGAGVAYARCHNVIMRHSDVLDIATLADFCGNVWQCNALMIPTPMRAEKQCYLQPVGHVMRLFGAHQGKHALELATNGTVDAVASRTGNTIYLHLANTSMTTDETLTLELGQPIESAKMYYIAADPTTEITPCNMDCFAERVVAIEGNTLTLPRAAVAAVEITVGA